MTALIWEEAAITKQHDRASFDSGDADLNLYVQKFARQNHESGSAKCFVAVPAEMPDRILAFYSLSPASLEYARTPALAKKRALGAMMCRCFVSADWQSITVSRAGGWAVLCSFVPLTAAFVLRRMWAVLPF